MYDDRLHDSCGVFGIHAPGLDVARLTFFGLYALQHRGQESAGIAVADDGQITVIKDLGLVSQVFNEQMLQSLSGQHAIGHVRYSTTGASHWQNSQPLVRSRNGDVIALGHNGNLVNTTALRDELLAQGVKFSGTTDTEVITALIAHESEGDLLEGVRTAVSKIRGAFSAAVMSGDAVVGFRDPYGVRPLCLGDYEGHPVFSSETSGLDIIGAEFVREIQPGEIVIADSEHGLRSERVELEGARPALCIFEFIYFARPDSVMNGKTLHVVRQNMGRHLSHGGPGGGRPRRPGPGHGHAGGDRLRRRLRHPLHRGPHQEPLRAPHVHPARRQPAPGRHPHEAQPADLGDQGQAAHRRRRLHRARQHDAPAGATCCSTPAPPRSTCASARRRSSGPATTASTWRPAPSSSRPTSRWTRSATTSAPPACTTSRSTASRPAPACRASQFCRACFDGDYPIEVPEEYAMCKMRFEKGAAAAACES